MSKRLAVVAMVLAFGLVATLEAQRGKAGPEALMQADLDFAKDTAAKRVDGWVAWFAADGMQLTPEGNIKGHAAIREYMGAAFARPDWSLTWKPTFAEMSRSGDLGYTTGTYESRGKDAQGQPTLRTGRYVSIWKKQADGTWKVVLDTGHPDAEKK